LQKQFPTKVHSFYILSDSALPLHDFFEAVERSANIGNWSESDRIQVCVLKLTDAAKAFYKVSIDLCDPDISWQNFKLAFQKRFRDVRSDQYHFLKLQTAREATSETVQEFADKCRILAHYTNPTTDEPAIRKIYQEQEERMILASITQG
jgi:hypothetical protein